MKYCRSCFHLSAGNPAFCPSCGGSYDVKRCPRGHPNNRSALACAECGSRELSLPQPARRAVVRTILFFARVVLGPALLAGTVVFATMFSAAILHDPSTLLPGMIVGLGLAVAWLLFTFI